MSERSAKQSERIIRVTGILLVVVAVLLVAAMLYQQRSSIGKEVRTREARLKAGPRVHVVPVTRAPETQSLSFVGEARPYLETTLYSKVSGYLSVINVDKGDKVVTDQLLAVMQSPELDRQYAAAVADATSKRLVAQRNNELLANGSVSPQTAELSEAAAKTAEETAASLLAQKDYELMRAPFPGTITARYVDPGALIQSATTEQTSAQPIVTLSKTDRLRVYVYPDQKTASFIRVGDPADISDVSRGNIKVSGSVGRTSGRLDTKTRTLLVEIDVDNREEKIIAGSFVQVTLKVRTPGLMEIPADALVIRGEKSFVATLTGKDKVAFKEVAIYESSGKTVRLSEGVTEGEHLIVNAGLSLTEGQQVRPAGPPALP
jgi:membrane fusion protein (multidrug efflux system)